MPPRYAYWTILIDGAATAFRAREREELLPTLHQLQRKNQNVTMQWFARGKLWESREAEQEDFQRHKRHAEAPFAKAPSSGERRNADWRPGGAHKDPRDRFKKKHRPVRAWSEDDEPRDRKPQGPPSDRPWQGRKPAGPPRENKPWQGKKPGGAPRERWAKDRKPEAPRDERPSNRPANDARPPRERSWTDRPPRENKPWQDRKPGPPRGDRPWSGKPKYGTPKSDVGHPPRKDRPWTGKPAAGRPRSDRPWDKKAGDRPREERPWSNKPPGDGPRSDRPWTPGRPPRGDKPWQDRKAGGAPRGDRPWSDKPPRSAPRGDKPWQDRKPAGPPRGDRPWSAKPPAGGQREKRTWGAKPPGKPEQGGERKPWRDKPGGGSGARPFAPKRRDTRKRRDDEPPDE